jgi:hypothetical protein
MRIDKARQKRTAHGIYKVMAGGQIPLQLLIRSNRNHAPIRDMHGRIADHTKLLQLRTHARTVRSGKRKDLSTVDDDGMMGDFRLQEPILNTVVRLYSELSIRYS